jgi:DNA-binding beta-propeller fold protein YncE
MSFIKKLKTPYSILFLLLILVVPTFTLVKNATNNPGVAKAAAPTLHYLYVFPDGAIDIYDMDHGHRLVKQISLPIFKGGRGCVVDPASHMLYLSYNGDGGPHGNGSLLKYDLVANKIVWTVNYPFGIDSPAITPDGKTIYMPDGESSYDGTWHVLNASNGSVKGTIFIGVGAAAHNTIINLSGTHVYMGALNWPYLVEADTITNKIIKQIGPLLPGVRPFTINKEETLAFTTASKVLGFQVSNINTGKVLYTVPVKGYSAPASAPVPSHGITLSPDQKEIYLIDTANSKAHVFDVSGLPKVAPRQVADIPLRTMIGTETPCAYDCTHEGWILHSLDGHYVYVGDSGDVIDTRARKVVANLAPLFNTRKYLEIDWSNGVPVATSTRHGLGYA